MRRKQFDWHLPAEIEQRLGDSTYGRQRAIFEADHLLLILHSPPKPEDIEREAQVFLRKPDGTYQFQGREGGEVKLKQLLGSYRDLFQQLDAAYENAHTASELFQIMERLAPLNRSSTNLHNALQSAREGVGDDPFIISLRDEAYDISRNFELLLADSKLALDYRIAKHAEAQAAKSEEMAGAQHKLNTLAAMTFPLMAISTIFGMNLANGLENEPDFLFWIVVAAAFAVGFVTKGWVTRPRIEKRAPLPPLPKKAGR